MTHRTGRSRADAYRADHQEWLNALAASPDLDFDPLNPPDEVRAWLFEVYTDHGALPVGHLAPLVHARRLRLADAAAVALRSAYGPRGRQGGTIAPVVGEPPNEAAPMGRVQCGEQTVSALDPQGVAVEVADGFQCFVADALFRVWPVCPVHGNGVHPRLVAGVAVWVCPATGHTVGPVGPALPD